MNQTRLRYFIAGTVLFGVLLVIFYDLQISTGKQPAPDRSTAVPDCAGCNLILLNIEMLRADQVGLINPESGNTPNIDKFFANGVVFTDVSSGSGATYLSATATATATETMLNEHDVWSIKRPGGGGVQIPIVMNRDGKLLIDYFPTIAQILSRNGYHTASINQWIHSGKVVSLERGFKDYIELPKGNSQLLFEDQVRIIVDAVSEFTGSKFYLYFHPNSLHFNFHLPYDRAESIPEFLPTVARFSQQEKDRIIVRARNRTPPEDLVWWAYEEQTRYVDDELGRFFQFLTGSDLLDNTIVVLYSNHGVGLDENGKMEVGLPYRPFLHVPLMIRHPHVKKQIRVISAASLVDLAPTLYSMLGIDIDHEISTYSMNPMINGAENPRRYIFSKDIQHESVRKGDWKLVVTGGKIRELYNLRLDPDEQKNVIEIFSDTARELEFALTQKRLEQSLYAIKMKVYFNVPE